MLEKFSFYLEKNLAKRGLPNKEESSSLIEKAIQRMDFIKSQRVDKTTATFVFEEIYECLREAAQSLMSLEGYKPYSHEAVIAFLKDFHSFGEDKIAAFNRYRILRNKCVYAAAKISPETCREAADFLDSFLPKLKAEFEKKARIDIEK